MQDLETRNQYLNAMGIDIWVERQDVEPEVEVVARASVAPVRAKEPSPRTVPQPVTGLETLDWAALEDKVSGCTACDLHQTRTQTVFGVGDRQADWLIIGEAPGADEDRQGEPFVGRAGQLLNAMLVAIGLQRDKVFIANILKCRPPNNRDPRQEEAACCEGYLKRQIALLQPKLILVVGRIAAHNLLKSKEPIGRMRGKLFHYGDTKIPVVVTYHPAYLLRSPKEKAKSWADLKFATKIYQDQL